MSSGSSGPARQASVSSSGQSGQQSAARREMQRMQGGRAPAGGGRVGRRVVPGTDQQGDGLGQREQERRGPYGCGRRFHGGGRRSADPVRPPLLVRRPSAPPPASTSGSAPPSGRQRRSSRRVAAARAGKPRHIAGQGGSAACTVLPRAPGPAVGWAGRPTAGSPLLPPPTASPCHPLLLARQFSVVDLGHEFSAVHSRPFILGCYGLTVPPRPQRPQRSEPAAAATAAEPSLTPASCAPDLRVYGRIRHAFRPPPRSPPPPSRRRRRTTGRARNGPNHPRPAHGPALATTSTHRRKRTPHCSPRSPGSAAP